MLRKPLPLTTVELQKSGSRLLKLAPKKLLDVRFSVDDLPKINNFDTFTQVAEKLYQQGFLSYPRTETDQFDPQFDHMTLIRKQKVDPNWGAFATKLAISPSSIHNSIVTRAHIVLNKRMALARPARERTTTKPTRLSTPPHMWLTLLAMRSACMSLSLGDIWRVVRKMRRDGRRLWKLSVGVRGLLLVVCHDPPTLIISCQDLGYA
jgi:DNA topoisomerase-3